MDQSIIARPASALITLPTIGEICASQGGIYLGIGRGFDSLDAHCFMAVDMPEQDMSQPDLLEWGQALRVDDFADFQVWDKYESALAWANARDKVDPQFWYWTRTQYSPGRACSQDFNGGSQYGGNTKFEARARAVRRLPVNSSIL